MRQHAIAALNVTQQAKQLAVNVGDAEESANTALIDGVRKFAMDVRELDIDLIDRIIIRSVKPMRSSLSHRFRWLGRQ